MTVNVNDVLRVDVEGDFDGSELIMNSYQFRHEGASAISDQDAKDDMRQLLEGLCNAIDFLYDVLVVFRRIRVQNLTTGLAMGEEPFATPVTGTGLGGATPPGIAALVEFGLENSNGKARKFYGPVAQNALSSQGNLLSTWVTPLVAAVESFFSPILVVNSVWEFGHLGGTPATWSQWTTIEGSTNPAYQRRRRRGRGA